jgi:hypothetical protein
MIMEARCWWLKSVILAKKFMKPHLKIKTLGVVVHACHPSNTWKHKIGRWRSKPAWANSEILIPEQPDQKRLEARLKW